MEMTKIQEVLANEEFFKSYVKLDSAEAMKEALVKQGVAEADAKEFSDGMKELTEKIKSGEITKEQFLSLCKRAESGELSEEALEDVAGGVFVADDALYIVGIAVVCALAGYGLGNLFDWLFD